MIATVVAHGSVLCRPADEGGSQYQPEPAPSTRNEASEASATATAHEESIVSKPTPKFKLRAILTKAISGRKLWTRCQSSLNASLIGIASI